MAEHSESRVIVLQKADKKIMYQEMFHKKSASKPSSQVASPYHNSFAQLAKTVWVLMK